MACAGKLYGVLTVSSTGLSDLILPTVWNQREWPRATAEWPRATAEWHGQRSIVRFSWSHSIHTSHQASIKLQGSSAFESCHHVMWFQSLSGHVFYGFLGEARAYCENVRYSLIQKRFSKISSILLLRSFVLCFALDYSCSQNHSCNHCAPSPTGSRQRQRYTPHTHTHTALHKRIMTRLTINY